MPAKIAPISPQTWGSASRGVARRELEDVGGRLPAGAAERPAVEEQAELVDRRRRPRSARAMRGELRAARRACGSSRSGRR